MKKPPQPKNKPKVEGEDVVNIFETLEWANERAAKIWEGQSTHLSILERVGRIKVGLSDKGFTDFKNLTIPTQLDYKRYL